MDERAKFPLPIAVVCSVLLILSCFFPQAGNLKQKNIGFHSYLIFDSHPANPALLAAELHDGGLVIVTEDHHLQFVQAGKIVHSKSLLLESTTRLITPSRLVIGWGNGTVLALSNGLLVAHSLPELNLLWRHVVPGVPIAITHEGQFVYTLYDDDDDEHYRVVKLSDETGAKQWTSPPVRKVSVDNIAELVDFHTGQPLDDTTINATQVLFGPKGCFRIRHARSVVSTCVPNNEQWEVATDVMAFMNTSQGSNRPNVVGGASAFVKPRMDHNNNRLVVLAVRSNRDLYCLGANDGVIWERSNIVSVGRLTLALQNQQVVAVTSTQIQSISTNDGSTTATMDFSSPIATTTTGGLFLLENGQVYRVVLQDRTQTTWFIPPLSFIPVVLSLIVLWAAIFWSRLESIM